MAAGSSGVLRVFLAALVLCGKAAGLGEPVEATGDLEQEVRKVPGPHHEVQGAAPALAFALRELKGLSDSGIYETLSLAKVSTADFERGVFHDNWIFDIELSSPHFSDGRAQSAHKVTVMRSLEDQVLSFAIDEFPDMEPSAIEFFWRKMVERHRKQREESFERLEAEELARDASDAGIEDAQGEVQKMQKMQNEELEGIEKGHAGARALTDFHQYIAGQILDKRWDAQMLAEQSDYNQHIARVVQSGTSLFPEYSRVGSGRHGDGEL